jgi:membrane protein implicated in regulation of membrane protease activity
MSGWAIFYLVCFVVGVTLSVLSFLGGSFHLPHVHVHVPHVNAHVHTGPVSAPHVTGGVQTQVIHPGGAEAHMPVFNFATITAFLAWFGGTGYLLTRYSTLIVSLIMLLAVIAGLVGASIIFWFVAKLLLKHDRELDPADYDRIGVLGRIISPIRAGGTGEIIFSQEGTRQTCGARSEAGEALPRDIEVIITRYEGGIAYVRRWDEMANGKKASDATAGS